MPGAGCPQRSDHARAPLHGIHKRFGTVAALRDVSLPVRRGTVHALLGENGAGKTTLMRVAFGMVRRRQGRSRFTARAVPRHRRRAIAPDSAWCTSTSRSCRR